jgi:hypothetical protein
MLSGKCDQTLYFPILVQIELLCRRVHHLQVKLVRSTQFASIIRFTTGSTAGSFPTASTLLYLFTPFLTLIAISSVTPATSASELEIQCLLTLLDHGTDFISDSLSKLLSTGKVDAVEHNDPRGLIQGCG